MAAVDPAQQVGGEVAAPTRIVLEAARGRTRWAGLRGSLLGRFEGALRIPAAIRDAVAQQSSRSMTALAALLDGARDLDQVLVHSPSTRGAR